MTIDAMLSDLRSAIPGCHVAAFIDLSAKMVLSHDARSKAPQERLDALADRARRLLNAPGVLPSAPDHVVAISADNLEIFVRARPDGADSLALVCGLETEVGPAVQSGLAMLEAMRRDA